MNTTDNNTSRDASRDTGLDTPAARADAGTVGREDAVRLQRWATGDQADFSALAGEMVATLYAFDDLAVVLGRQVGGYADTQRSRGRGVYDDTREVDPRARLAEVVAALTRTRAAVSAALRAANDFWSAIGHIGVEDSTGTTGTPGVTGGAR